MTILLILMSTYLSEVDKEVRRLEDKVSPYVVSVHTHKGDISMTGTVIDAHSVVTVCFVREGEPLQIEDKYGNLSRAKSRGRDPVTGITLIETEETFNTPIISENLEKGQLCYAYGNSFGKMGIIGMGFIQSPEGISFNLSIPLSPGNNGAGVFDVNGRLLGIIGGRVSSPGFLYNLGGITNPGNFAEVIKVEYMLNTIGQIREMGTVKRGWLGIVGRNAPGGMGIIVDEIIIGSPAKTSGIQKHDLIIALNGNNISDFERFKEMLLSQSPGDTVRITIIRRKSRLEILVQLEERKSGIDWERLAPDFRIEKITPKQFEEGRERVKEEIMKQLLRLSEEIESLKKQIEEKDY